MLIYERNVHTKMRAPAYIGAEKIMFSSKPDGQTDSPTDGRTKNVIGNHPCDSSSWTRPTPGELGLIRDSRFPNRDMTLLFVGGIKRFKL